MTATPHAAGPAPILAQLAQRQAASDAAGLRRSLQLPAGKDFSSNDSLGFAADPALQTGLVQRLQAAGPLGAPASRLLRGHLPVHASLERRLAAFKGYPAALLLPAGYMANLALVSALVGPADRVLSDACNHASIIDALRLSRCTKVVLPHLDMAALAAALREPHGGGNTYVFTESLFSMDGDIAPLRLMAKLCQRHGAGLLVDDAHATGLYGARRSGLVEEAGVAHQVLAVTCTFGKALAAGGACIAAPAAVVEAIINHARPFIFTTAMAPVLAHLVNAALDLLQQQPERASRVLTLAHALRQQLRRAGLNCGCSDGPIVPVILGDNERTMAAAAAMRQLGFDIRGIRPPTVLPGTARLRICVHANHTPADIDAVAAALINYVNTRGAP